MSTVNKIRKLITMTAVDIAQALQSLKIPGKVLTADFSAGWIDIGESNILRVQVTADTYVAFSDDDPGVGVTVSVTSDPGLKIDVGYHYILCQSRWVRMSSDPTRKELLEMK